MIKIGDEQVKAGENRLIELQVARLPSGTSIHLPIHVFSSSNPGPAVLICGGLHGDEVNGIEVVRQIIDAGALDYLNKGCVIAMPIINIYGFINFSRDVPDGKDVNRSFPGNIDGSLASHVAYILTHHILPLIDFGIDFHTGGASRTNYPQVRYNSDDINSHRLAKIFAAPFLLNTQYIDSSLRWQANQMGKTTIVYEGGESLRLDDFAIREAIDGTYRVLSHFGLIDKVVKKQKSIDLIRNTWVRAPRAGIFKSLKKSGQPVEHGEIIGEINDPYNAENIPVEAHETGFIIGHNNMPVVHRGDALFNLGLS